MIGSIKFFNVDRGFGFIAPADGGKDVFVHISDAGGLDILREGERVQFEEGTSRDGRAKAINVRRA